MNENGMTARIFMIPIQYPCGPNSGCCGHIGQSEEEVQNLKALIEKELSLKVEVINVMDGSIMKKHLPVVRILRSFGALSLPIITLEEEIVSMGNPTPEEAVSAIKDKIN